MEVPSSDPTSYCRICFARQQRPKWILHQQMEPHYQTFVDQIYKCLAIWLTPEEDFPCAVCPVCATSLDMIEALRDRSRECDLALRVSRLAKDQQQHQQNEVDGMPVEETSSEEHEAKYSVISTQVGETSDVERRSEMEDSAEQPKMNIVVKMVERQMTSPEGKNLSPKFKLKFKPMPHSKQSSATKSPCANGTSTLKRQREFVPKSAKEIRKQLNLYSSEQPPVNGPRLDGLYQCNYCTATFYQYGGVVKHKMKFHAVRKENSPKSMGKYRDCAKIFTQLDVCFHGRFEMLAIYKQFDVYIQSFIYFETK